MSSTNSCSYQFNPQLSNPDVIINILIKALAATVHGPDFGLCLALLREPAAILHDIDSEDESLITAMPFLEHLHELMRTCQFTKFWSEFKGSSEAANILHSNPTYFSAHKGLVPQLRNQFASSIAASFRRIRTAQLARWLDLSAADVPAWVKSAGWEIDGDYAVVPPNGDNDVKAGVVKENVELKRECSCRVFADTSQSSPSSSLPRRTRRGWCCGRTSRDVHMHVVDNLHSDRLTHRGTAKLVVMIAITLPHIRPAHRITGTSLHGTRPFLHSVNHIVPPYALRKPLSMSVVHLEALTQWSPRWSCHAQACAACFPSARPSSSSSRT